MKKCRDIREHDGKIRLMWLTDDRLILVDVVVIVLIHIPVFVNSLFCKRIRTILPITCYTNINVVVVVTVAIYMSIYNFSVYRASCQQKCCSIHHQILRCSFILTFSFKVLSLVSKLQLFV